MKPRPIPSLETARLVAVREFGLAQDCELEYLPEGRVNLSFRVRTGDGDYILQRLHAVFGLDGAVIGNVDAVIESLTSSDLPCPTLIRTVQGRPWAEAEGQWRLMTWLPGAAGRSRTPAGVAEAARFLGSFHRALARKPPRLATLPPAEHNQEGHLNPADWEELSRRHRGETKAEAVAGALNQGRDLAAKTPVLGMVTRAYVHGDPKWENFLFDEQGRVVSLIDLDTVREGFLLWELAGALRSWTGRWPDRGEPVLDLESFVAAAASYRRHGLIMAAGEWLTLPAAVQAATLRLAWRYFHDYFEETYFAWDSRRYACLAEQNLARGLGLLKLARDLADHEGYLRGWLLPEP
ncbi:MAG: phosphotransferase [Thermodesulfobacteriota bacterium]